MILNPQMERHTPKPLRTRPRCIYAMYNVYLSVCVCVSFDGVNTVNRLTKRRQEQVWKLCRGRIHTRWCIHNTHTHTHIYIKNTVHKDTQVRGILTVFSNNFTPRACFPLSTYIRLSYGFSSIRNADSIIEP